MAIIKIEKDKLSGMYHVSVHKLKTELEKLLTKDLDTADKAFIERQIYVLKNYTKHKTTLLGPVTLKIINETWKKYK
jgi:hypothetical protein